MQLATPTEEVGGSGSIKEEDIDNPP